MVENPTRDEAKRDVKNSLLLLTQENDLQIVNCPGSSHDCEELLKVLVQRYASLIKVPPDKPEESVEAAVRALWSCAVGVPSSSVGAMSLPLSPLTEAQLDQLMALLERRASGVPLCYITGRQQFMGLELRSTDAAFIPRKETEVMVKAACSLLVGEILPRNSKPRVLDLGTGTGNLSCYVARQFPECTIIATDISPAAAQLAEENIKRLGCEEKVKVLVGDLFAPFQAGDEQNSFDLILCNPPYISTTKLQQIDPEISEHEPKLAIDAGPFGLAVLGRLMRDAPLYTRPGGWLAFELGVGQGPGTMKRLSKDARYQRVNGFMDDDKNVRAIAAQISDNKPGVQ